MARTAGRKQGVKTIAFPAISTGIYGYPLIPATRIAVETVRACLADDDTIESVTFVAYNQETLAAYAHALAL